MAFSFIGADGQFSQQAWVDYWRALWSAPSQPGYATVVREGLAALRTLATTIHQQAQTIGDGAKEGAQLAFEALNQLGPYIAIAGATQDGDLLSSSVVQPLLTNGDAPLLKLGRAIPTVLASRPLRSWEEIFDGEIVKPTTRAAKAIAAKAGFSILPIAVVAVAIYFLTRKGGGGED